MEFRFGRRVDLEGEPLMLTVVLDDGSGVSVELDDERKLPHVFREIADAVDRHFRQSPQKHQLHAADLVAGG